MGLKEFLESLYIKKCVFSCFVSDSDIASGSYWRSDLNDALKRSDAGIICITKDSVNAPWLMFEAGALAIQDISIIPLLIDCDQQKFSTSPLQRYQFVELENQKQFYKMIMDLFHALDIRTTDICSDQVEKNYTLLKEKTRETIDFLHSINPKFP